jgi:anti-sigma regulatory factor (Ser/Thr protein kinase)
MARPEIVPDAGLTHAVLPADRKAPSAARSLLLRFCLGRSLDARMLSDAQLLMSEFVTNAVLHGARSDSDSIVVRFHLDAETLRLEVHDAGLTGTIAANGSDAHRDRDRSHGRGLDLVTMLSTAWGVRREADTCVWLEMARA